MSHRALPQMCITEMKPISTPEAADDLAVRGTGPTRRSRPQATRLGASGSASVMGVVSSYGQAQASARYTSENVTGAAPRDLQTVSYATQW